MELLKEGYYTSIKKQSHIWILSPSNIVIGIRGKALLTDISGIGGITSEWIAPEMQTGNHGEVSFEEQKLNQI